MESLLQRLELNIIRIILLKKMGHNIVVRKDENNISC